MNDLADIVQRAEEIASSHSNPEHRLAAFEKLLGHFLAEHRDNLLWRLADEATHLLADMHDDSKDCKFHKPPGEGCMACYAQEEIARLAEELSPLKLARGKR